MTADARNPARQPPAEEAEEAMLTMARLDRFDATRQGVPAEDLRDWMLERRTDPAAPCPKAKPIP